MTSCSAGDYVQMAPGTKTPRQFQPDNPIWWVVQSGEVRFTIEGQDPFVATKGFLVQVPYRNIYQLEAVGTAPALVVRSEGHRFSDDVPGRRNAGAGARHGVREGAHQRQGELQRHRAAVPRLSTARSRRGERVAGAFVSDPRAFANVIRGMPQADNPKDKGHFHEVSAEFWFVLEGTINYKIGDLPIFDAAQGDVVFVPKQMWHRAHHGGTGYSTRLAMNGYPQLLHNFQLSEEMR